MVRKAQKQEENGCSMWQNSSSFIVFHILIQQEFMLAAFLTKNIESYGT